VTIAACYVTPEGVVFGADSTASAMLSGGFHYFNYNQKVFEIGEFEQGTLGIVTWGLGGLGIKSYRTLLALLNDDLLANPPKDVTDVATRWADLFWTDYSPLLVRCRALHAKPAFVKSSKVNPLARTEAEEEELDQLKRGLFVGFCIGGYTMPTRTPEAFSLSFDPLLGKPSPVPIGMTWAFWGAPNMIKRLVFGCDDELKDAITNSGKWNGTPAELEALIDRHKLATPYLPIRDAIDFVHACIFSTIKAMKFSNLAQICGGPIELAVITTDRRLRWVRHKDWDAAISDGAS
jgi:hypothetical protein